MKSKLLFLVFCMVTCSVYAQYPLTGVVKDGAEGSPVPYSTAALLRPDSSVITGVMGNDDGKFVIQNVAAGKYLLQVSFVGYEKEYRMVNVPAESNLGDIFLSESANKLQEVVVTASSRVVQKSDRIVFLVTNENLTKGRSSNELLKFTPMIRTGQSEKIEIVGKDGFVLYINNRRTTMDSDEIHAYLSTMPAEQIVSIEVITDPGVTMRTGGVNQGIINLILKKNEANGMNGSLTVQDMQGRLNSQNGGLFINYQKDKLNVSANVSANRMKMKSSEISDFYYTESNIHQNLENDNNLTNNSLIGTIRADYNLSNNQVLGLAYSASFVDTKTRRNDITHIGHIREELIDSILKSESNAKAPVFNQSLNLNYRMKTSTKGNLSIDAYYLRNDRKQTINNSIEALDESTSFEQYQQRTEEPMNNYSGKVEYTHTFRPGNNLTFGTEVYHITAVSDFFYGNRRSGGAYESDPQKSNEFSYRESYVGAYISYLRVWNPKFNSRIELVGEYVDSKGVQRVTSEEIVRNDFGISPSVSLQYQHSPAHRVSYNLSSYVNRPGFYSLNPFQFWLTPTTYKEYNPNLKPSRTYINTLNYNIKGRYTIVLGYTYIDQCRNNFLIPVDGQYTKYVNANYGTLQNVNMTFNWNQSFWKNRVSVNTNFSGTYQTSSGVVETIIVDTKSFYWNASINGNIRISDRYKWNLTGNFNYNSKMKLAQENNSDIYRLSIGVNKIFAKNISLNLGVQNLIFTSPTRDKVNDNYEYYTSSKFDMRQAYIGITIPFGNTKARGASNRNASLSKVGGRLKEN